MIYAQDYVFKNRIVVIKSLYDYNFVITWLNKTDIENLTKNEWKLKNYFLWISGKNIWVGYKDQSLLFYYLY